MYQLPSESSDSAPGNQPETSKKSVLQSTEASLVNSALGELNRGPGSRGLPVEETIATSHSMSVLKN